MTCVQPYCKAQLVDMTDVNKRRMNYVTIMNYVERSRTMHNLLFFDHNLIKSDVEVKICCVLFSAKAKILNKKNTQQYFHNNEI